MKFLCALLVAVIVTPFNLNLLAQPAPKQNLKELLSKWKVVRGEHAGQEVANDQLLPKGMILEFDANRVKSSHPKEGLEEGTYTADATKSPKRLDITYTEGREKGKKQYCIYKVEADKLTIVFGVPGGKEEDRPNKFTTSKDNLNVVLIVFERVKQADKP